MARPSGGLERDVVAVLSTAETALTPGQVQAALGGDLAYTTVDDRADAAARQGRCHPATLRSRLRLPVGRRHFNPYGPPDANAA